MANYYKKYSTLYFQKKAVCFAKQKVKDSKILLSFYNVLKIPKSDALTKSFFYYTSSGGGTSPSIVADGSSKCVE